MIQLDVDFLTYNEIADVAHSFLDQYNKDGEIPVPIEEIIEFELEMDIIPIPNLQRDFDIEGFPSKDFTSIYVDEFIYKNRPYRYRFTLAHEVGHKFLHNDKLSEIDIDPSNAVDSWVRFIAQVDSDDYNRMEFQGYAFGGIVLVPTKILKYHFDENLESITALISA